MLPRGFLGTRGDILMDLVVLNEVKFLTLTLRQAGDPICSFPPSGDDDISIGHRSATVCHLGNIGVRTGKKINWNPETETIAGDPDAAKWLMKEYRKPYQLT